MTQGLLKKPSQEERILKILDDANGGYVPGRKFLNELGISQYHARIFSLQKKLKDSGCRIEADDGDEYGFKSYCLIKVDQQQGLF